MKRDLDLQTKILQRLEDAGPNEELRSMEGYSHAEFCYNARQLHWAGLIDIISFAHQADPLACMATGLTPAGHDVLDRAKNRVAAQAQVSRRPRRSDHLRECLARHPGSDNALTMERPDA